jgi:NitT/TauT family transport system substrate-binding protein
MRTNARTPIRAILVFAALLLLMLPSHALEKLRVGKAVPAAFSFTPLDVGMTTGIFARHGLEIEEAAFGGSAKLHQALAADSLDIGLGSGPELAFVAKGAPVLGVAAMAGAPLLLGLVVGKNSPVHAIADVKGRTVSCSTAGSLTSWLLRELSRQQGWGPDGINVLPLGADNTQIAAMRIGQTEGMPLDLATAYRLQEQGEVRLLMKFGDLVKDFHMHVIYARRALIASDPGAVRNFLAGWFETIAYMRKNKDETVRIAAPVMNAPPEIAAKVYDETMAMFSDDGHFDAKALETLRRSFVEMNLLPSEPDMSKLYTTQFLPNPAKS